ncbi:hypothetical protein [Paludisphaera mucosa]|uniref:Cytochrome c domain-containing protein n=1 Tax=Paludisphaera mucosa TaxID=3030827 RepID=A0ABT6FKE8_9BACT|nr:hypothetical protein [Paludisphaera mucosa]MDG3008027.1 hypothetical protein [Paludisphaera mucosa]
MLIISLVVSALLLLAVDRASRRGADARAWIIIIAGVFAFGPFLLMLVLPTVMIQALLLCVVAILWGVRGGGPAAFRRMALGATVIAYGIGGLMAHSSFREAARLRGLYPLESMEARVPAPRADAAESPPGPDSLARLARLEESGGYEGEFRGWQLRILHENTVGSFIDAPGFGVARMLRPSEALLAVGLRKAGVPRQPGPRIPFSGSPGELRGVDPEAEAPLGPLLEASILDFVNPEGFGYVRDRRHVAGFETHQFSRIPEPASRWKLRNLELASLLLHEEPVVYTSAELPRMDRLHGKPTRPLDRFEGPALGALRRGEDLVVARDGDSVRMLGAVRSLAACVACHGGARGDLLGAFSYDLAPDARTSPSASESEESVSLGPPPPGP